MSVSGSPVWLRWGGRTIAVLLAIVSLAAVLRFWHLRDLPAGLYCDEAANGYNAYSLWQTGRDEHGTPWPLYVWSFGTSYKNPVYIYSTIVPVALLGLDELSTRATAAAYGTLTVLAVALAGAELFGVTAGLAAAAFLAVQPWHLHFSRIAFELICFPCLFVLAVACTGRAARGSQGAWHAAAVLFALCAYAYAPAKLFVPLFVMWLAFVYPSARRQGRWALLTFVAVGLPWMCFDALHAEQVALRLNHTGISRISDEPVQLAWVYWWHYVSFLTPDFLFRDGDTILRHAVRGFGELSLTSAPFVVAGILAGARDGRAGLLLLGWILLYPVTGALQQESPSASHGIIGAPAFALLAGVGFSEVIRAAARIRWTAVARLAAPLVAILTVGLLGLETTRYWRTYRLDYPRYSAATWEGFQYGYRELITYMESRRSHFDQLLVTSTDGNQPYIFTLFYPPIDPAAWQREDRRDYQVVDPADRSQYRLDRRTLFALRPAELALFSDHTVERRVTAPNGQVQFVVAEVREAVTSDK